MARFLRSPALAKAIKARAEQGAALARLRLPTATGALRASVHVEETEVIVGGARRVAAVIVADAPHAAAVEFGTRASRGRGQHVLGSVADTLSPRRRRI